MKKCHDCRTDSNYLIDETLLKPFPEFAGRTVGFYHDGVTIYEYINYYLVIGQFENNVPKLICDGYDCKKYVDDKEIDKGIWNNNFEAWCKKCAKKIRIEKSIIPLITYQQSRII